ncbi:MAG: amidohydrolase [Methanobacteriota archaeon]|nr:MAG: amidohydrolase [Euryarchaeota archaeon]
MMKMDARCADAVYYNGRFMTFAPGRKTAHAVAVADGRIIALGSDAEIRRSAPRGAEKVDLGGKTVVPGFIDSHTHFIQMGIDAQNVDLFGTKSLDEALTLLKAHAGRTAEGRWVIGANYRESNWVDGRFITRSDLDECSSQHPVVAHRICGHLSSVNTRGMEVASITSDTPGAETDSSGELTGIVTEAAVGLLRAAAAPTERDRSKGLRLATKKAHSLGVTSIQDNGEPRDFFIYREAERKGRLKIRVWFNTPSSGLDSLTSLGLTSGLGSERLRLGGVKIFCDGALGARTAALTEPYADDARCRGMLIHSREEMKDMAVMANDAGIQLVIHAIGDDGIEVALASIEHALRQYRRRDHRHRIEHLELPTRGHIGRIRKHKVIASMQPNFVGEWSGIDGLYVERLGRERAGRNNPFREVLDAKIKLAFGSDCMPFSPIYGIRSAVNAPYEPQRLTVQEAFASYTRDAAFASFEEEVKGTIAVGRVADFAVLSGDPFKDQGVLDSIFVAKTVLGGEVVFDRSIRRKQE